MSPVCPGRSSVLRIDLGAIRANYRAIAERGAPAACGAVVKADAYGLGIAQVAPALAREGCRIFFVAQLCEAPPLRRALGGEGEIFVLNGVDPGGEEACAEQGFVPVLNAPGQVERWRATARALGRRLPAALQADSGMSRLGLDIGDLAGLAADADLRRELDLRLLLSHLACADEPEHAANARQLERFAAARALFPDVAASIANSGGTALPVRFRLDVLRPGVALFGVQAGPAMPPPRPVAALHARVLQIRAIAAGEGVGYGLDYVADSPRRLATVGIGYGDGWPRSLGGVGAAFLDGVRLPIVGRISMDSLTVDISALAPEALAEGDFVELLGPHQSLADVAREAGTIPYEILTRLGPRHLRVHVEDDLPGDAP